MGPKRPRIIDAWAWNFNIRLDMPPGEQGSIFNQQVVWRMSNFGLEKIREIVIS